MENRAVFQKSYTRDTTLVIQQLWFSALTVGIGQELGITHPFSPFGVDYINQGAIEIWENVEAKKYIESKLIEKSFSDTNFLKDFLLAYETNLAEFEAVWKKNNLKSLEHLLSFVNKVDMAMCGDMTLCYFAGLEGPEQEVRNLAERLRVTDHFFASNDFVIRESLKRLFPNLGEFVVCVKLEELFGKMPTREECEKRFKNFVVASDGYTQVETLEEYRKKHLTLEFEEAESDFTLQEIKGRVGVRGKVVGKVKVVHLVSEINKVDSGDIIVSPMTTPAFMPALIKASAFVTDEGGVLCHAVVVAREMNKPCIISTKIATEVLKDGDTVEVNANDGIVKIIKRAL